MAGNVLSAQRNPMSTMSNPLSQMNPPVKDPGGEAAQAKQASQRRADQAQAQSQVQRREQAVSDQQSRANAYKGVGQQVSTVA
ncbi:MAG: hypothetical protein JXX28_03940 [Deltaproteobacteria bacterium]|nr:hypothetical protein [Deltaproteobacteria bacterium]